MIRTSVGECDQCGAQASVLLSLEDEAWPDFLDSRCPTCAIEACRPESNVMFVARALRGDAPFAQLYAAARAQRENPEMVRRQVELGRQLDKARKLQTRIGIASPRPARNRREKRKLRALQEKRAKVRP